MNKSIVSGLLATAAGNAAAHSHPAVDALTHAAEHLTIDAQAWLPYLLGLSTVALCGILIRFRQRRDSGRRRSK